MARPTGLARPLAMTGGVSCSASGDLAAPMRLMRRIGWACSAVAAVLTSLALATCLPADAHIIAKARKAPVARPAQALSEPTRAAFQINIPFERISKTLNQFEFKSQAKGVASVPIVGRVHYEGNGIVGRITLKASGQPELPIELTAPFRWTGSIGGFDVMADGELIVDFGVTVGPSWCPLVELGEPRLELYPDKTIDLANVPFANTVLRHLVADELKKLLSCEALKSRLATLWHANSLPLEFGDRTFILNISPESIALTNASVVNDRLVLKSSVSLTTVLSGSVQKTEKISLPRPELNPRPVTRGDGDIEAEISLKLGLEFP